MSYDFPVDDKVMNTSDTSCLRLWSCRLPGQSHGLWRLVSGPREHFFNAAMPRLPLHVVLVVACPRAAYLCWCSCTGAVHKFDLHGEAAKRAVSANIAEVHGILWAGRVTGHLFVHLDSDLATAVSRGSNGLNMLKP